ncbi:MAG: RNA polymerase sigma factor RpoH [Proteobacteria bacterium]|nr:RNA polymerase sigma factor RpoH [Pseudomonadota bacterium]
MNTQLQRINVNLPVMVDGMQSYLQRINAIPLLSADEEKALATRYQEQGDLLAAQQLVLANVRYVVRIANQYNGYGLNANDLIQEGTIGLMKAVKRFDPKVGVRLVSFAVHWIKSEIHEFIIRNWRIVKVATTKAQRKLFFNLRQAKKRLGWFSAEEVKAVAQDLGVSPADVVEMESRLNAHDDTFDPLSDDDESAFSPASFLPAPLESSPHYAVEDNRGSNTGMLHQALTTLDDRSLDIVQQRWLNNEKASLKTLAEKYGISIERVRQLEKTAMDKLRQKIIVNDPDTVNN